MSDQFKVVFSGKITEGFDAETVISAFAEKFRCSEAKARALVLAGKETVIKSDLDKAKAEKYRSVLVAMGLETELVALQPVTKPSMAFELEGDEPVSNNDVSVPAANSQSCPKCGSKQTADDRCLDCKIVISKYVAIQETGQAFTAAPVKSAVDAAPADNISAAFSGNSSSASFDYNATAATDNPYQAPEADLSQEYEEGELTDPVSVPMSHGWFWLSEGFGHFKSNPVAWIVAIVIWVIISSVLSFIPFVGSLAVTLLSPVITAGFMLGCQSQEEGGDFTIAHLFSGFSKNTGQLFLVGLLYLVAVIVVMVVIGLFAGGAVFMLGAGNPEMMGSGMMSAIMLPVLLGSLAMFPVLMAYWFAPALVVLNDMSAIEAMKLSFSACLKNILPGILYFISAAVLMIIGAIPFGLGLLVVLPMMAASVYRGYREIFYS
jgi:uncharacterized membrane protein